MSGWAMQMPPKFGKPWLQCRTTLLQRSPTPRSCITRATRFTNSLWSLKPGSIPSLTGLSFMILLWRGRSSSKLCQCSGRRACQVAGVFFILVHVMAAPQILETDSSQAAAFAGILMTRLHCSGVDCDSALLASDATETFATASSQ